MGTEKDGVDEAAAATQPSFTVAPTVRASDPDVTAVGATAESGIIASSRTRFGSSHPGPAGADREGGGSTAQAGVQRDLAGKSAEESVTAPIPAGDTEAAGNEPGWDSGQEARDRAPTFTPSSGSASARDFAAYRAESYSGSPRTSSSSYAGTAPAAPQASPSYSAPDPGWPSRTEVPPPGAQPAGGGFSATAAAAVSGAATGLAGYANSVSSAWQTRAATKKPKATVRQSNKRQALLTLTRVEPWSVMKFSFVASVVAFIILFVAVAVLYMALSALGVFDSLQHTVSTITASKNAAGTNISHYFSASLILGYTAMLGALNIVLITALCTIGSVIYNLIAKTVGGIEVILKETE